MSFPQFEAQAAAIPYQYKVPRFLYALIRWLSPIHVVEVGTHLGMSAVWMARALQENGDGGRLTCIDPFCWREEAQEASWNANIDACGVRDTVTLIKGRSQEVEWPARVDFAYIDGNHTYEVCKHDIQRAVDLGATCVAIHDTVSWEGSRRCADELRSRTVWDILENNAECGLLIAKKREPKPPCEGRDVGEKWDKP